MRIVLALVLAVVVGGFALRMQPGGEGTVTVVNRSLVRTAEITGQLEAEDSLEFGPPSGIGSQWNFKISYLAPEGELVEAGQPLIRFDPTELRTQLLEAISNLETAETNLAKRETSSNLENEDQQLQLAEAEAEAGKAKLKAEAPESVVAGRELDKARIDLAAAESKGSHLRAKTRAQHEQAERELDSLRARVRSSRERVTNLQSDIEALTVVAPQPGTVVYRTTWRGEKPKVGDQAHRMLKVVSLPNLDRMRATARIDEVFAAEVAVGQKVVFSMDAFPNETFEGVIRGINPAVQRRSRRDPRKAVRVDIAIAEPDPKRMRPGMRIQGELEILRTEPTPTLPLEAIQWDGAEAAVRVDGWFGERTIQPQLGRRDEQWVEVQGGLELGDRILLPGSGP